jgi:MFS family permease
MEKIGVLAANPAVRGAGQLVAGALSDRIGRNPLIVRGMRSRPRPWL